MAKSGYQNRIELVQGTLDMLVLKTLQWGEQHGYGINQERFSASSNEVLQVETGSLYPALHRLERAGWVSAEWKKSDANQRAKFYRITALGKKQLAADYERWGRMVATIEAIMSAEGECAMSLFDGRKKDLKLMRLNTHLRMATADRVARGANEEDAQREMRCVSLGICLWLRM